MANEATRKAVQKYLDDKEQVRLWVKKGEKKKYKQIAEADGKSLAELIRIAVKEYAENHGL